MTKDGIRIGSLLLALAFGAGACAGSPIPLYSGPLREPEAVAVLEMTKSARVYAINGVTTYGKRWALLPGAHYAWLAAMVSTSAPSPQWRVWTFCRLKFRVDAGERYSTELRTTKQIGEDRIEKVRFEMRIIDRDGVSRGEVVDCTGFQPRPAELEPGRPVSDGVDPSSDA